MGTGDHYFKQLPDSQSDPIDIEVELRGLRFTLKSDAGVFSKDRVDTGTTVLARNMQLPSEGAILDLGCGYGVLGILAALECPDARVTLVDVNERAAELARGNAERLVLRNVEVLSGDAREVLGDRRFDCVLCNPPYRAGKALIMGVVEDAASRLNPGGSVWIVGRTKQGIKTLARDLSAFFDEMETVAIKSGYRVVRLGKLA